ncbi:hypothetical protein L596_003556 [Steinernema carpocapsae]|uniref:Uncharacterized protein n=1 Tax=Steinernema carpocapsae TaxID=34508 RepID=A0A4U8UWZ4_STECR|nr:hypothetical protein L596_003556 [Steinernema carpocapsae]
MSLSIALELFDRFRQCLCPQQAISTTDHGRLAEQILAGATLFDLLRWRRVSSTFKRVADRRIKMISRLDVKLYAGLRSLHKGSSICPKPGNAYTWHSRGPIMIVHISSDHLGIAVDSKMDRSEIAVLVEILSVFRQTVEKLFLDCPVMEFLVSQVDKQQLNVLHFCLVNSRKQSMESGATTFDPEGILSERDAHLESPFFPKLRQLTVTSQTDQLEHLSRLLLYTVGVEHIYDPTCIELVCLNVCLAGSWSRVKNVRLFRHVNCFRQWSEAQNLGVRYLQQFTSHNRKPLVL